MKMALYFALLLVCSSHFSCHKDTVAAVDNNFPNQVGNTWEYSVIDSTLKQTYTLHVTIVGQTKIAGGKQAQVWLFDSPIGKDTNFVVQNGSSVLFYQNRYDNAPIVRRYDFPLSVGNQWVTSISSDITRVTEQKNIDTPAGQFTSAYHVHRNIPILANYRLTEDTWFKPGIGIVKLYRNEYNFGPPLIQTWELRSYQFSKP